MKNNKSQKGQSLIELALVLPVLLLILLGIVDFGKAYVTLVALNDAASEGATYASIDPTATTEIANRAAGSAGGGLAEFDPANVTVAYANPAAGQPITVTVTYEYQVLTPVISMLLPDGKLVLAAHATQPIMGGQ